MSEASDKYTELYDKRLKLEAKINDDISNMAIIFYRIEDDWKNVKFSDSSFPVRLIKDNDTIPIGSWPSLQIIKDDIMIWHELDTKLEYAYDMLSNKEKNVMVRTK